jgi:hypothetical protein
MTANETDIDEERKKEKKNKWGLHTSNTENSASSVAAKKGECRAR